MTIDWDERITPHFTRRELGSPDTGEVRFEPGFLDALEALRRAFGEPMAITSGCRTHAHNAALQRDGLPAHPTSLHMIDNPKWHTDACAVDVSCRDSAYRWRLLRAATDHDFALGLGSNFLHLDLRQRFIGLEPRAFQY